VPAVVYFLAARLRGVPLWTRETRLGRDACPLQFSRVRDDLGLPASDLVNLPAFVAVVRGRLSLVGPYPLPPACASLLADWQRLRFEVRPGLVGFWRNLAPEEVDLERVVRLDLHYVQSASPGLDFQLLLQGLGPMLTGRNGRLDLGPASGMPRESEEASR
jgi:hypothetical protein